MVRLTGRGDPAEQSPKRRLSRVARVTAPLAVVVVGVAVLLTIRGGRQVPASVESTPASAPALVEATPPAAPASVEAIPPAAPAAAPVQTPKAGAVAAPADAAPGGPCPNGASVGEHGQGSHRSAQSRWGGTHHCRGPQRQSEEFRPCWNPPAGLRRRRSRGY